jgi:hypothetical protein
MIMMTNAFASTASASFMDCVCEMTCNSKWCGCSTCLGNLGGGGSGGVPCSGMPRGGKGNKCIEGDLSSVEAKTEPDSVLSSSQSNSMDGTLHGR